MIKKIVTFMAILFFSMIPLTMAAAGPPPETGAELLTVVDPAEGIFTQVVLGNDLVNTVSPYAYWDIGIYNTSNPDADLILFSSEQYNIYTEFPTDFCCLSFNNGTITNHMNGESADIGETFGIYFYWSDTGNEEEGYSLVSQSSGNEGGIDYFEIYDIEGVGSVITCGDLFCMTMVGATSVPISTPVPSAAFLFAGGIGCILMVKKNNIK